MRKMTLTANLLQPGDYVVEGPEHLRFQTVTAHPRRDRSTPLGMLVVRVGKGKLVGVGAGALCEIERRERGAESRDEMAPDIPLGYHSALLSPAFRGPQNAVAGARLPDATKTYSNRTRQPQHVRHVGKKGK